MLRLGLLLVGVALLPTSLPGQDVGYRVVVHKSNSVNRLTRDQLSKIFLRQLAFWENRQHVLPVDQSADSPVRRTFTKQIHQRTIASVQTWWQQQIFTGGEVPPPEAHPIPRSWSTSASTRARSATSVPVFPSVQT